jgi:hypothetical protein
LSPREGDSSRVPQYERNILHVISDEERFNVFDFIFQKIWNVDVSNKQSYAYAPYIMKMIEKVSKKTFVKNIEHTKLQPNKQFTSIKPRATTPIPPLDAPNNYRGSGPGLLKMLRSIFTACRASKEVIIKRQEVILRNQHIIHCKLEIGKPLEDLSPPKSLLTPIDPSPPKSLLTFRWVRQGVPMLLMATTTIRMMMMSQMMGRVVPFYSCNVLSTICLSLSFVFNVVEP